MQRADNRGKEEPDGLHKKVYKSIAGFILHALLKDNSISSMNFSLENTLIMGG